jgi:hypothetical protein
MIKMPVSKQMKSKGMIAGWGLMALGVYVVIGQKDVTGGGSIFGIGLAVLGLRDA